MSKKMGRPALENARTERLSVRVSKAEKKEIEKQAKEQNLTISQLILKALKI